MNRTIARSFGLVVAAAAVQACSRANATGRPAGTPVAHAATAAPTRPATGDLAATVPAQPAARMLEVAAGQTLELRTLSALTSRSNHAGDRIEATAVGAALTASGDTVIPASAVFHGTVREIAAAPNPHAQAHLVLAFTTVRVGDSTRPIDVRVTAMPTKLVGRGVTGGTVAKVGAGAVIGGLAGKLLGHSGAATVIGAAAGGAAGGVYANATRNLDIVLPAGSVVRVTIAAPFDRLTAVK